MTTDEFIAVCIIVLFATSLGYFVGRSHGWTDGYRQGRENWRAK